MTETPPTPESTSSIADELSALGKNLVAALRSALNSEESKKVQNEVETGLNDAIASLQKAADDFSKTDTGQQLKDDLADLNQRIETGELQAKLRADVVSALQTANTEIQKAAAKFSASSKKTDVGQD
jgi:hypothetical protein